MGSNTVFAFSVTFDRGGLLRDYVVAGVDFAAAAALARERGSSLGRLHRMEHIGQVLGHPVATAVEDLDPGPRPTAVGSTAPTTRESSAPGGWTRRDQLLALLRQRGGPVHLEDAARELGIRRGHADQVARVAIRAGLVRRVGRRTGQVEFSADEPAAEVAPVARPVGGTRVEQLVRLLEAREAAVHIHEIGEALETGPGNVQNIVAAAVKARVVRRVGRRTGLVELPARPQEEQDARGSAPPARVDPAGLDGLQRRIFDAISALTGWSTASDVACVLGVRPREAGNALALLVDSGLVQRERGDGTPARPTRYRVVDA